MSEKPRISIVIVTYKSMPFIDRCLAPIAGKAEFEIIVWENASSDGLADHVSTAYPDVLVFDSPDNLGFARGNNAAFDHCTGDYVLLLNPDAFLETSKQVHALAGWLDAHPDHAACGPQLVHADGSHQVGDAGWRISLKSVTAHSFMLQRALPALPSLYLTNSRLRRRQSVDVDWVCGACMMVRRDVIQSVGGLDADVFMYGEDIEWGTRMRQAGWKVAYLPQIMVTHLQGASQKDSGALFASTKWMDDVAMRYCQSGKKSGYLALRAALASGFALRGVLFAAGSLVRRKSSLFDKSRIAFAFARHALSLPSYRNWRKDRAHL